jgi:hypothetical protein
MLWREGLPIMLGAFAQHLRSGALANPFAITLRMGLNVNCCYHLHRIAISV